MAVVDPFKAFNEIGNDSDAESTNQNEGQQESQGEYDWGDGDGEDDEDPDPDGPPATIPIGDTEKLAEPGKDVDPRKDPDLDPESESKPEPESESKPEPESETGHESKCDESCKQDASATPPSALGNSPSVPDLLEIARLQFDVHHWMTQMDYARAKMEQAQAEANDKISVLKVHGNLDESFSTVIVKPGSDEQSDEGPVGNWPSKKTWRDSPLSELLSELNKIPKFGAKKYENLSSEVPTLGDLHDRVQKGDLKKVPLISPDTAEVIESILCDYLKELSEADDHAKELTGE